MSCGELHEGLPAFGPPAPELVNRIPSTEREARVQMTKDWCIVDDSVFFLLGCLDIPIRGEDETFRFLVWVSQSEASFRRAMELWHSPGRERQPPTFGWLSTALPLYVNTLSLKTHVFTRSVGERPTIELEPSNHPLARQQRDGISREEAIAIATTLLHGHEPPAARAAQIARAIFRAYVGRRGEPHETHIFDARTAVAAPLLETVHVLAWRSDEKVTLRTIGASQHEPPDGCRTELSMELGSAADVEPHARLLANLANFLCSHGVLRSGPLHVHVSDELRTEGLSAVTVDVAEAPLVEGVRELHVRADETETATDAPVLRQDLWPPT